MWKQGRQRGECGGGGDLRVTQGDTGRTDLVVAVDGDGRGLDQAHLESLVGPEGETLLGLVRDLRTGTQGHGDGSQPGWESASQPPAWPCLRPCPHAVPIHDLDPSLSSSPNPGTLFLSPPLPPSMSPTSFPSLSLFQSLCMSPTPPASPPLVPVLSPPVSPASSSSPSPSCPCPCPQLHPLPIVVPLPVPSLSHHVPIPVPSCSCPIMSPSLPHLVPVPMPPTSLPCRGR